MLSNDLALPPKDLLYRVKSAPYRYKVYEIAKKAPGKTRTIAQPAKELKPLQYWVMKNVLSKFPIHSAAFAYRKGRNILDNAIPHASHRYLCKLDFRNFFPSIKATDFERFMRLSPLAAKWSKEALLHGSGESRATLFPASLRCDVKTADRVGAACIQHSIEDGHSDSRFSLLARAAPRSQAGTDDGLVSAHRGFN
jgi:hypothetical protein